MKVEYNQKLFGRCFLVREISPDLSLGDREKRIFQTQKQLALLAGQKTRRRMTSCTDYTPDSR